MAKVKWMNYSLPACFLAAWLLQGFGLLAGARVDNSFVSYHSEDLPFAQRIEYHRRIERILYERRIWPKENPQPKPSFEEMVPAADIEAKAIDGILKSAALRRFWNVEITPAMLQAEMDRMARDTNSPEMLQKMFAALGNDPNLIAETLARNNVADSLIHKLYDNDPALHRNTRLRAEALRATVVMTRDWQVLASHEGLVWFRRSVISNRGNMSPNQAEQLPEDSRVISADDFSILLQNFPSDGGPKPPEERPDGFVIERASFSTPTFLEIETIFVPKLSFDRWWDRIATSPLASLRPDNGVTNMANYYLPVINAAVCDQWRPTTIFNAPSARSDHTAVWTGVEMVIWGGGNTGDVTGGRYNPAMDTWQSTSTGANVPSHRKFHTALWTGSRMIIWGGWDGKFNYNTGALYNPINNTWTPTSVVNAPIPRRAHVAVWTGTEMIVWGGGYLSCNMIACNSASYNDGGRYDPGFNTWISTSTGTHVPAARMDLAAVWTGQEMIIWGGGGWTCVSLSCNYWVLNSGGRYNSASDSWTPTSIGSYLPVARSRHTAIWTNQEMIVWGGSDYLNPALETGGKYSPAGDQWVTTSLATNLPAARDRHTAVWSGAEMIIWGGCDNGNNSCFNSGGRYISDADAWLTTSLGVNLPAARALHSMVWTGNNTIIWGGYGTAAPYYLDTGAVYTSGSAPSPGNSLRGNKSSSVNLTWSWITGAGSYNVKRCDASTGGCTPTAIVSTPTINQYSEPDDGLSYFYAIEAVNACGATP